MLYYSRGSAQTNLDNEDLRQGLYEALERLGKRRKVIAVGPDISRFHSRAGYLTGQAWRYYGSALTDVLPALGTHAPMTPDEMKSMYGEVPSGLFRVHDWKNGLATLGAVPSEVVQKLSEGKLDFEWPAQVNARLVNGNYNLILSIGQVVPHEVIGMANYNKNLFVGTGGRDGINRSHYLGAVYGLERIMGRAESPVRALMDYASDHFAGSLPQVVYVLTVVAADAEGELRTRGLFIGDDRECYEEAARLAQQVNITRVEQPLPNVVAWMDPSEYRSTWIGNKAVYRTRMAIADGGRLTVIAPGVKEFGEDPEIDRLIRKYGYAGTENVLRLVRENRDLQESLGAAAHLIHGSTEGRFSVVYCPGRLSREEIESVNYSYADPDEMLRRYTPDERSDGYHRLPDGEEFYLVKNPALGLWTARELD
ncbi:MAG: lactate racemase domain-containing protein [Sediminispirochaetaceae bacterium]